MSNRARLIAGALAILLWMVCAEATRADPFSDRVILNLRANLVERNQQIEDYMHIEVMKCETGALTLNIDASAVAGAAVYDYNGASGCKYMLLPEPSISLMLALGCLGLAGRGRDRARLAEKLQDPYVLGGGGSNSIG